MKSVTAGFQVAQKLPNTKPTYHVYYKRRYWNAATTAYVWESSWTKLPDSERVSVDPVVHQFDTQTLNEFKVSNVVLNLLNDKMQWKEGSGTYSKFKSDGVSSFGYEPYLMKFQIRAGFANVGETDLREGARLSLGSEELLTIFTGVAVDFQMDTDSRTAKIYVEGLERLLLNGDASRVATTVTLETIGTGDGADTVFYTQNRGVGKITTVTVNAVTMIKGVDYEVANLNNIDECAEITLAQPPTSGQLVKCTYEHWKKNKTVDQLISDLISEAGISSSSITNATLGSISNNITLGSQADFEAGTNTLLDTATAPGKAIPNLDKQLWNDFASGNLAANGWSHSSGSGFAVTSGKLVWTAPTAGTIKRTYSTNFAYGVWQYEVQLSHSTVRTDVGFLSRGDGTSGNYMSVRWGDAYDSVTDPAGLRLHVKRPGESGKIVGRADGLAVDTSNHTIKIVRNGGGHIDVYFDGALVIEYDEESFGYGDRFIIDSDQVTPTTETATFDNIYIPGTTPAIHESQTIDTLSGITAWGKVSVDVELARFDSMSVETRTSTDGSSWDSWTAVSATNGILSAVKRYIQVRIKITVSTSTIDTSYDNTSILAYTVQFTSDRVFIGMGNFSGMDCYGAIQELAKFSDFEWGVDDDEQFFFRPRTTSSTPDETFTQGRNLSRILYQKNGYDFTYSIVKAQFGSFLAESAASADVRTSALEIYGRRFFTISSSMLVDKDTNVADAIAAAYLTRLSSKKRRLRILCKFWPQIELSDTLSVTFNHDPHSPSAPEPFITALICKVIYTKHDPENARSEFEVEEIL